MNEYSIYKKIECQVIIHVLAQSEQSKIEEKRKEPVSKTKKTKKKILVLFLNERLIQIEWALDFEKLND